jgi:hypothetical protein
MRHARHRRQPETLVPASPETGSPNRKGGWTIRATAIVDMPAISSGRQRRARKDTPAASCNRHPNTSFSNIQHKNPIRNARVMKTLTNSESGIRLSAAYIRQSSALVKKDRSQIRRAARAGFCTTGVSGSSAIDSLCWDGRDRGSS